MGPTLPQIVFNVTVNGDVYLGPFATNAPPPKDPFQRRTFIVRVLQILLNLLLAVLLGAGAIWPDWFRQKERVPVQPPHSQVEQLKPDTPPRS